MTAPSFPHLLQAFFQDWLGGQRNLSRHTVLSYRDTWRLFLRFVASRKMRAVAQLAFVDLTEVEVLAFLRHCEDDRHTSIGTRNCRLAALRVFFRFVADREPTVAADCAAVLRIPTKRTSKPALCYLETDEVTAILNQPDRSTAGGQRDHVLLSFLYNTGARIQEALNVCPDALRLDPPTQVRLFGKGRKERICPLWPETTDLIIALLRRQPRVAQEPIFVNRFGRPLGAAGVRFKLQHYVQSAAQHVPSLTSKHVSPHTFRHSTAVALVSAGVDVTVIRSWLGHAHLDTTNHYARASLDTKREALERVEPSARPGKPPRWKRDPALLAWLDAL
jgi:site-specific recombinase XerD